MWENPADQHILKQQPRSKSLKSNFFLINLHWKQLRGAEMDVREISQTLSSQLKHNEVSADDESFKLECKGKWFASKQKLTQLLFKFAFLLSAKRSEIWEVERKPGNTCCDVTCTNFLSSISGNTQFLKVWSNLHLKNKKHHLSPHLSSAKTKRANRSSDSSVTPSHLLFNLPSRHVGQKDANLNRKRNIQRWSEDESGTRGRIRASAEREQRGGRGGVCVCVDTERHVIWICRRLKIKTQSGTTETRNQVWVSLTAGFIRALRT